MTKQERKLRTKAVLFDFFAIFSTKQRQPKTPRRVITVPNITLSFYILFQSINPTKKMTEKIWLTLLTLIILSNSFQCSIDPAFDEYIDKQLSYFSNGITNTMIQKAKKYPNMVGISYNNGVFGITSGRLPAKLKLFLMDIAPNIPNLQFVMNNYDEARVLKRPCRPQQDWKKCSCDANFTDFSHGQFIKPCTWAPIYEQLPVFSHSSVPECFLDIIMPSPHHVVNHYFRNRLTWQDKQFKAIWRGGTTGGNFGGSWCTRTNFEPNPIHYSKFHRQRLVRLCQTIPDCDAKFSLYYICSPDICQKMRHDYGDPQCIVTENQFINKLIIDIDGNSYSRRFPILLASGSVVIKIATYADIGTIPAKPWVHYIPVKMDLSDFQERLQWAKENDKQLQQIGKRGEQLAYGTLKIKHYRCYMTKLLVKYHDLLVSQQVYQQNTRKNP